MAMDKAKGTRGQLSGGRIVTPPETAITLSDLNITKSQSPRWQKIATIPGVRIRKTRRRFRRRAARNHVAETSLIRNETNPAYHTETRNSQFGLTFISGSVVILSDDAGG